MDLEVLAEMAIVLILTAALRVEVQLLVFQLCQIEEVVERTLLGALNLAAVALVWSLFATQPQWTSR
jgi:hypothetical protein